MHQPLGNVHARVIRSFVNRQRSIAQLSPAWLQLHSFSSLHWSLMESSSAPGICRSPRVFLKATQNGIGNSSSTLVWCCYWQAVKECAAAWVDWMQQLTHHIPFIISPSCYVPWPWGQREFNNGVLKSNFLYTRLLLLLYYYACVAGDAHSNAPMQHHVPPTRCSSISVTYVRSCVSNCGWIDWNEFNHHS